MNRPLLIVGLLFLFFSAAFAQPEKYYPKQLGVVSDYVDVLSPSVEAEIERQAALLKKFTSVNLKVAIFYSISTLEIISYAEELYRHWDVGQTAKKLDDGVLIIITWAEQDARVVAGQGVSHVLNEQARENLKYLILGALVDGDFSKACVLGTTAVTQLIMSGPKKEPPGYKIFSWLFPLSVLLLFALLAPLAFNGDFLMGYSIVIGGFFGYLFFGLPGMVAVAALAFLLNFLKL
ncbi:MAG: TPM domain-containing protein [Candidatus Margulisiibacteriota bacterium]|jgi:uncharacterized membrane protein YgcG